MKKAIYNGNVVDENEAKICIADKGYFFDFSVYSSIKVIQGKIFFAEYHANRLFDSAKIIDLQHQFTQEQVVKWMEALVKENNLDNALLRTVMIGDADENRDAKLFIFCVGGLTFYADKLYKHGAKVITYEGERRFPTAKTTDLLLSFLALKEAKKADALDALLVDRDGFIREGTRTNFYAIREDELIIPPSEKVLEGVTKKIILDLAKDDFSIREEDISPYRLAEYEEFFISSTSMNVMPIKQIDDYEIKTNFAKTRKIAALFKEYYENNILR